MHEINEGDEIIRLKEEYRAELMEPFLLAPRETALVVVDMQYAGASRSAGLGKLLLDQGKEDLVRYRFERIEKTVIPNIQRGLDFFRRAGLRVVYVTQGSLLHDYSDILPQRRNFMRAANNRKGTLEHEILTEVTPQAGEIVLNKTTIGAFASSPIDSVLRAMGIKYLVFSGISTNMCVEATAREAVDRGYYCVLLADACGANKKNYHDASLLTFQRSYGRVENLETVLAELKEKLQTEVSS